MGTFHILCWTLNMILNILLPLYVTNNINKTINMRYGDHIYGYSVVYSSVTEKIDVPLEKALTMVIRPGDIFSQEKTCMLETHHLTIFHPLTPNLGGTSRSTDLILKHMTLANLLVLLSKGIPETLAALGSKHFLNDFGCRLLFYIQKVSRDVSIGTTCILSVFQVIMISPRDSRWAQLQGKAPRYLGTFSILCWVLNTMLNISVPLYTTDRLNNTTSIRHIDHIYCFSVGYSSMAEKIYVSLVSFRDGFRLGLMVGSSGSMVLILHRHKQRVRYIHRHDQSARPSPETTATQSILVLVCCFVSLWTLSSVLHSCVAIFNNPSFWLKNTSKLIAACFPALSPYILMSHDSRVSRCFFL
ncbi:vomeronasal type-1 receptor 4-like [Phacochoerus africanus]|uniref:vomeronasal type-1 receptor 4-like n=1 Tax=Phacochoerus africanus TaxID=41426 RepID=UPI001FDA584E|nr:vomeronasal type-1 receptor 4-like [Phacochoerus africanus]